MVALLMDAAKGTVAVLLAVSLGRSPWVAVVAGWLAVVGHNYPLWLRLRGGKGLATSFGVVLALFPALSWLTLGGIVVVLGLTKNLAFTGLAVGLALALGAALAAYPLAYPCAPLGLLLLMAWKQFPDLQRMWRSNPNKRDLILNRWIRDREGKL